MQGTLLEVRVNAIMDINLALRIETMMYGKAVVHRPTKVPGGMTGATLRTSMVATLMDNTCPMLME